MKLLVSDTSVLLNLLAGGCLESLSATLGMQFVVCRAVRKEVQKLRDPETGEMVPVDLDAWIRDGYVEVVELQDPEEEARYVDEAASVDDGEAMSIAIASYRGLELAIDDRRAVNHVKRVYPNLVIWGTPELLKAWSDKGGVERAHLKSVVRSIEERARFFPRRNHELASWWASVVAQ